MWQMIVLAIIWYADTHYYDPIDREIEAMTQS